MSSPSGSSSLAILGLFLALAFIVPGVVYVAFLYVWFPPLRPSIASFNYAAGLLTIAVVLGLLVTAICFTIEWIIVRPLLGRAGIATPNIPLQGKLEAHNVSTVYLSQVFGQFIMHYNIGLGVLLILIAYLGVGRIDPSLVQQGPLSTYSLTAGIIVAVSNLYLALMPFRLFSLRAQDSYEATISRRAGCVFDLDNTLVETATLFQQAHEPIISKFLEKNPRLDREAIDRQIWELDRELAFQNKNPAYDKKLLMEKLSDNFKLGLAPKVVEELADDFRHAFEIIPELKKGATNLLRSLSNGGWHLILLTSGEKPRVDTVLEKRKIAEYFHAIRVVKSKTENQYQEMMLELTKLGCDAKVCIGDSIEKEITFGNKAGFVTVWIASKWESSLPKAEAPDSLPNYLCAGLPVLKPILQSIREKSRDKEPVS